MSDIKIAITANSPTTAKRNAALLQLAKDISSIYTDAHTHKKTDKGDATYAIGDTHNTKGCCISRCRVLRHAALCGNPPKITVEVCDAVGRSTQEESDTIYNMFNDWLHHNKHLVKGFTFTFETPHASPISDE